MNNQELNFILQEGEGYNIEFKESLNNLDEEIVAFANSTGGRIFLGVTDNSKVKGINISNKLKSQIQDIANNCDPKIKIKLEEFKDIIIIHVEEGLDKPYKCKEGFYLRQGPNSQKMKRDEIIELIHDSGKVRFDEIINKNFDFKKDFDKEKLKTFLKQNNLSTNLIDKNILMNLGLAVKENKKILLNNAGILFFSKNPQKFFLHAYLDCVLFKGAEKSDIIDRKTFRSDLLNQLNSAKEFIKKHLNLRYDFKDFERKEEYEIPIRAIEEALVNALMHRDYFFKGANISLFIYDDRIEIISPGGLPKGLDKKNFGKLSVRRNQIIADIFSRTLYVEKIGSGIKRMRTLTKKANLPVPKFEINNFFIVVFKRKKLSEPLNVPESPRKVPEKSQKIIEEIRKNPYVSRKELSVSLNESENTIQSKLRKLIKEKIIQRIGPAKGGYWKIKEVKNE